MRSGFKRAAILKQTGAVLTSVFLVLALVGCSLGETMMPAPPTGVAAERAAGTVIAVPNPIPHTLEGREDCFACHAIGAVDAPAVPPDHEREVTLCTTCHAVWLAPVIAAAAPPAIPHPVEGQEDCLVCHKVGTADAPRVPDNHDSLTGDICQTCHIQVDEIIQGGEEGAPIVEIPLIPHALEGFSACTSCHAEGGSGVPRMPNDHEGRTDDICSACHRPSVEEAEVTPSPTAQAIAEPTETPAALAGDAAEGQVLYAGRCAACHGAEGEGTTFAPDALNDPSLMEELTDEDLRTTIRMGVSGKMPASPNLSDQDVLDIIALLRSWR